MNGMTSAGRRAVGPPELLQLLGWQLVLSITMLGFPIAGLWVEVYSPGLWLSNRMKLRTFRGGSMSYSNLLGSPFRFRDLHLILNDSFRISSISCATIDYSWRYRSIATFRFRLRPGILHSLPVAPIPRRPRAHWAPQTAHMKSAILNNGLNCLLLILWVKFRSVVYVS